MKLSPPFKKLNRKNGMFFFILAEKSGKMHQMWLNKLTLILSLHADLVGDVRHGDVFVDFDGGLVVPEQIEDVGDGRGDPSPPLVEEFVESGGAVGVGVGSGRVLDPVAPLE